MNILNLRKMIRNLEVIPVRDEMEDKDIYVILANEEHRIVLDPDEFLSLQQSLNSLELTRD